MVSVDTVYQRVLALANKEQRGYITPQEFNLFANQAQMAIFEQYFYDIKQFGMEHGNDTEYSDMLDLLNKKLAPFTTSDVITSGGVGLPADVYRLGTVIHHEPGPDNFPVEVEEVKKNELLYMNLSPIARPTIKRPVYVRTGISTIQVHPTTIVDNLTCTYITAPIRRFGRDVKWGYAVVNEQALYNVDETTDFMLHSSEESSLVVNILELAGVTLNKPGLVQIAQNERNSTVTQEKQ
jgi:hypothetical protein|tara:strand:+ start:548 stop:1261 length:714 start_codon:yes stop_codon:yes gene_type:complete